MAPFHGGQSPQILAGIETWYQNGYDMGLESKLATSSQELLFSYWWEGCCWEAHSS